MNEVEKHYANQPDAAGSADRTVGGAGGAMESAKRAVEDVKDKAGQAYEAATGWARDQYGDASAWASDRYESAARQATYARRRSVAHLNRGRENVGHLVEENPIMLGVVGLAAGLLVGALLPSTRRENRYFGRYADGVKQQGLRYAQELADEGRALVEEQIGKIPQGRGAQEDGGSPGYRRG